ncbi:phage tail protein [Paenibacillus sp. LS1]|uniref:phage tail protein n=1 Tax=Paenibacillus sp. LS1 TaxID=2992120 RepID=UPI002232064E|nr:phage tail protein [Paenibacillus sp. LS1]MCW3793510.1 phage tail protein [Paenibacillus sp. LS1]
MNEPKTPNLGLNKIDRSSPSTTYFDLDKYLDQNWEKVDEGVATKQDLEELREAVGDIDVPDASLTQKGKVQLSSRTDGSSETVAATEKAINDARMAAILTSLPRSGGELTGPVRISNWGEVSASSGGYVLYGHNCYLDTAGVVYRYRNTHATMGARGIVFRIGTGLEGAWMFDMGAISTTAGASFVPTLKRLLNTDDYSAIVQDYIRQPGYAVTTGAATAYVVTLSPAPTSLPDGFAITIVPHVDNGATPTLNINGIGVVALKDQKGVAYAAGKLLAGRPYTFRKVGADFLADSGSSNGTAQPAQVLAGATFDNENGDQIGTMPDNGALGTLIPGTSNQTIPQGYTSGGTILGDTDLIASNIKSGVNIFGIVGNANTFAQADIAWTMANMPADTSNLNIKVDGRPYIDSDGNILSASIASTTSMLITKFNKNGTLLSSLSVTISGYSSPTTGRTFASKNGILQSNRFFAYTGTMLISSLSSPAGFLLAACIWNQSLGKLYRVYDNTSTVSVYEGVYTEVARVTSVSAESQAFLINDDLIMFGGSASMGTISFNGSTWAVTYSKTISNKDIYRMLINALMNR